MPSARIVTCVQRGKDQNHRYSGPDWLDNSGRETALVSNSIQVVESRRMLSKINPPATRIRKVLKALLPTRSRGFGAALAVSLLSLLQSPVLQAAWELNMPQGVTEISRTTYDLHMLIIWICV